MDPNWTPDLSSFVTLAASMLQGLLIPATRSLRVAVTRRPWSISNRSTDCLRALTSLSSVSNKHLLDILESGVVDENSTFEGLIQLVVAKIKKWQMPVAHGDRKYMRLWFGSTMTEFGMDVRTLIVFQ